MYSIIPPETLCILSISWLVSVQLQSAVVSQNKTKLSRNIEKIKKKKNPLNLSCTDYVSPVECTGIYFSELFMYLSLLPYFAASIGFPKIASRPMGAKPRRLQDPV